MKTFIQTLLFFLLITKICFGQVNWTKYPGNPVITVPGVWYAGAICCCVLFNTDSSRYEMFFSGSTKRDGQRPCRIGLAYSNNGLSWQVRSAPVLTPTSGEWDSYTVEMPSVIYENGIYKMWYSGTSTPTDYKIGYATSPDGINWTKHPTPVLGPGTDVWDAGGVEACYVMPVTGGYKMWYSGYNTIFTKECIGYATSTDGILWQRDTLNNPVLEPGVPGEWDDTWVAVPSVMFKDNLYYMWYLGTGISMGQFRIGLATSANGINNWTKHSANPVLRPSSSGWDRGEVESPNVILVGDTLYMYYDGSPSGNYVWQIGLATSHFEPVSVGNEPIQPTEFLLEQNYPNPFNPSTKIKYSIPQITNIQIKVYDVLGNEVETLVHEEKPAGAYEITWNAINLPSGVYFYQLKAGDFIQTKKMILMK